MRGLFFKVFIIFWIAQSLIFVISTALIVRHHFEGPEALFDTLDSSLQNDGNAAVAAWERGGCGALEAYGASIAQTVSLADAAGQPLCRPEGMEGLDKGVAIPNHIVGGQVGQQYMWRVPVVSASRKQYVFLLSRKHVPRRQSLSQDLLHFSFPQLPVAIVVGGLTTFVLVLLFTRPVIRLRRAAGELAKGKLNARVAWPKSQATIFAGDEIDALMHDFNHMAERLESLVDAQKLLLRDVSHELRSPLARLSVALELAREDADPTRAAHLDRIERETERLNLLIGQLLSLSSMEALEKVENFEPLSMNELIDRMIPDSEYEAQQRHCSLAFHADAECRVAGNEELLYRAIENVVRNAIRYTESGTEVEIRLKMGMVHGQKQAEIEVSDRGPGIPESQLSAIFRPFYRVDYARSPDTGGFGVGLAIAERAVRLHHGELNAMNRKSGGATIRITLPALETKPEVTLPNE
ncbi:MAG: ATP-binding protein [Terracidiphilus sp.]|jgi:two-component system sensor histidine kinase CpxA